MYKPVPQTSQNNDTGDDSETELVDISSVNYDKSPQHFHDLQCVDELNPSELREGTNKMSSSRKVALVASIFNCVAFTIIFLWVLPCDFDTCQSWLQVKDVEWQIRLDGKNVHMMDISMATQKSSIVLVLAATSDEELSVYPSSCGQNQSSSLSLLGVRLMDGIRLWGKNTSSSIQYLNCSIIDANGDGVNDCLIFASDGSLSALDSSTGTFLWELHSHQDRVLHNASRLGKLYEVNSVVDLNNDTILDLAAAVTTDSGMMYLMAISGRSGELLWQRELNASCVERPGNVVLYVTLDPSCFVLQGPFTPLTDGTTNLNLSATTRTTESQDPVTTNRLATLTRGFPANLHVFDGQHVLVTALVNCSASTTLLAKIHL